jgi:integrase
MRTKQITESVSDIYQYDKQIQGIFRKIDRDLPPRSRELIRKYDREMINTSKAKSTRRKHLQTIYVLSKLLNKEWDEATKDDIETLVSKIMDQFAAENGQESNYSYDHKKILKIFFRWLKLGSREFNEVGDPEETKKIKLGKVKDKIVREDLLTEDDRKKLLAACANNLRDRAFIDVQFEAGTRPGEILSLKIKHVKFDEYGAVIHVDGKTGARPVRLIRSTPNLSAWLDAHPFKENPEAPLWINLHKRNYGKALDSPSAKMIIVRLCRRAKITKRIYLNLFRHSEATEAAKFMTEAQLRKRHGWSPNSRMPARYVHLVNADVDEAIFKRYGIKRDDVNSPQLPKICHICKTPNSPDSDLCNRCGKPLDLKKALEIEEKMKEHNFMSNKVIGKALVQMLTTGQIPKLSNDEVNSLLSNLNLDRTSSFG